MLQNTFSAFDKKGQYFLGTFNSRSDAEAVRRFGDTVREKGNVLSDHPEDYALYKLGSFDDNSGKIVGETAPVFIVEAMSFVVPDSE